jgi:undecaprenyl-diphosphatase
MTGGRRLPLLPPPDDPSLPFGPAVARFDEAVDHALDRLRGHDVADRFAYGLSEAANFSLLWHGIALARAATGARGGWRAALRLSALIGVESLVVNQGIKRLFRRSRPIEPTARPHYLRAPSTSSFPSGHASAAFFAATLLADQGGPAWVWYGLATLVAMSRPYVRIHHASDVVVGAALGVGLAVLARRVWPAPWLAHG